MTDQTAHQPLTDQLLDEIDACVNSPLGSATDFDHTTVASLVAEVRRLKAVCGDLADRWDKEATGTQKAIDIDPLGGEVESAQHERVHVYRTTAQDLRALLATGRIPEDLLTTTERAAAVVSSADETPRSVR